jgi:hypothetical protein
MTEDRRRTNQRVTENTEKNTEKSELTKAAKQRRTTLLEFGSFIFCFSVFFSVFSVTLWLVLLSSAFRIE